MDYKTELDMTIKAFELILTNIKNSLDTSTKDGLKLVSHDISMMIEDYFKNKGIEDE
ncbi:MAG: hypothetical protein H8D94_00040 [Candidatus Pelagibacter sp.]|nr:hypothetical protein [Candidatus Pelagibacter sp.]